MDLWSQEQSFLLLSSKNADKRKAARNATRLNLYYLLDIYCPGEDAKARERVKRNNRS
jgi:hypothetical protein